MKKLLIVIGVLSAVVLGLAIYNGNKTIQPATVKPESTVSVSEDGSVIVRDKGASFVMAPVSR